ncbi:ribonuclease P protein subunit [Candidatus Micrarchaeota archaeon]|nr:ribonuclease P protein subunit [Candidatus Micrarchaeota archaeon]MBU1930738.1 ribonuclease P protein subunit [Candidatus Micrarchaeota archaeon]
MLKKWDITPTNLPYHEWIGLECKVIQATDPNKKGLKGKIIDETKNTIKIETTQGEKTLPKKEVELEVKIKQQKMILKPKEGCFSPENRVKAFFKKKKR